MKSKLRNDLIFLSVYKIRFFVVICLKLFLMGVMIIQNICVILLFIWGIIVIRF